jgi:hypothetical protein
MEDHLLHQMDLQVVEVEEQVEQDLIQVEDPAQAEDLEDQVQEIQLQDHQ